MSQLYEHTISTKDGQPVWIRSLEKEDAHHLVDLFEHMGSESRYLRFNLSLNNPDPDLVWAEARRLAQIDPKKDGAWLAFADLPGQPAAAEAAVVAVAEAAVVAAARYIRIDENAAEASLAVRDDMQNKGIGTELLKYLVNQAREAGIDKLVATVQRGNRPLWRLLQRSTLPTEYESEGSYSTITVHINAPPSPE